MRSPDSDRVKEYLVDRAKNDPMLLGKWQRRKGQFVVVYVTSEEWRDGLRLSRTKDLKKMGIKKKGFLPYGRGCKQFERVLGGWRCWNVGQRNPNQS